MFSKIYSESLRLNLRSSRGFTLVEMLTVMIVFIVIGSLAVSILATSFRTSNKTDIVALVQQNGNYALSQIAKTIRDARGLSDPFPCVPTIQVSSVSIMTPDYQTITYACSTTIASNGASLLDTTQVRLVSCSFTCSQETSSDLPLISIDFSLLQASGSSLVERIASQSAVPFDTSVVMRNINR